MIQVTDRCMQSNVHHFGSDRPHFNQRKLSRGSGPPRGLPIRMRCKLCACNLLGAILILRDVCLKKTVGKPFCMTRHAQFQPAPCMSCGETTVTEFLDLGMQPSGNAFVTRENVADEPLFSLRMGVCETCWQAQLLDHLDKATLFEDHPYLTGTNAPIVSHFGELAKRLTQKYGLTAEDLVLDIGCNDATLLTKFKEQGVSTMGVEPSARISQMARESGHVVANTFWNSETAAAIHNLQIKPRLITAMSVFYHVSDLHDFLSGVEVVSDRNTLFVVQAVSLMSLMEKNQFDHFYHEHTCIHSVMSLQDILSSHALKIIDVEETDVHGGSFIVTIAHLDSPHVTNRSVAAFVERERAAGLEAVETYLEFGERARDIGRRLRAMLVDLRASNKRVYGLGAPLKSSTFLNFADIGPTLIECLTEVNDLKIGKLSPGKHIPVVDERLLEDEPDYYVVFAWNYLDFLVEKKADFLAAGGKFIVPFPDLRVIGNDG